MPMRIMFLCAVACASLTAAHAQLLLPSPDETMIREMASVARTLLPKAKLSDGSLVPPETAAELSLPIIPDSLVLQTVRRGFLTGEMKACGMAWESMSFRPYMAGIRASRKYSDKQLAYIAVLHGFGQATAAGAVARLVSSCPQAHIERLETIVRQAPILTP